MLTIDDLKNVRRQKLRVAALEERIERLRSRAEYNQRQLGECGRSDPTRDRLAEYAAELDELEHELTGEMIALEKQLAFVDAELAKLPQVQEQVLRLRYFDKGNWSQIAFKMNFSARHCMRINEEAQNNLSKNVSGARMI